MASPVRATGHHACGLSACALVKECVRGGLQNVCDRCVDVPRWGHLPERSFVIGEDGECYLPFEQYISGTGKTVLLAIVLILFAAGIVQIILVQRKSYAEGLKKGAAKTAPSDASYQPLNKSESAAAPGDVILHGLFSWSLSQMRRWDSSPTPWVRYSIFRNFLSDFIIGVGLPMFYSFQSMVAVSAVLSAVVLYIAQRPLLDLGDVIETNKKLKVSAHGFSSENQSSLFEYANRMYIALGILYVLLLMVSCLHAKLSRDFAMVFNMNNTAMNDFTLKLRGLPRGWIYEENLKDVLEEKLRCKGQVIGTSIAYDLDVPEVQGAVWNMLERRFVQSDIACYRTLDNEDEKNLSASLMELQKNLREQHCGYPESMASAEQLDVEKDSGDFKKMWQAMKLVGSGHAFVVFNKKSHVDAVRMMYHGLWVEDVVVPEDEAQLRDLVNSLGPEVEGVSSTEMEAAVHKMRDAEGDHAPEQLVFRYLTRDVVLNDDTLLAGTKVYDASELKVKQRVKVDRMVTIEHTDGLEPTNFLWFNFGIRMAARQRAFWKTVAVTTVVFMTIVLVLYLPFYYFLDSPWSLAEGSPGPVSSQVQGIALGIAGNILGFANWQGLSRCGIFSKSALGKKFLAFSLVTSIVNIVFSLSSGLYFHIKFGFAKTDMTPAGSNEVKLVWTEYDLYRAWSQTLVPGWLFSGMVIGKLMGWFVPLLQNFLLCTLIYRVRCFPTPVSKVLCAIIPGNPPPDRLTARAAETVFGPPEVALSWEYSNYILTPTVCYCMLFCLGPDSYFIFVYLSAWVLLCYAMHRWPTLLISRKAMEGEAVGRMAESLWGIPVATVAAASSYWGIRCEALGEPALVQSYWMVLAIFLVGLLIHNVALREIGVRPTSFDLVDGDYDTTQRRLKYTWFNCNPVHVLKSCYAPELFRDNAQQSALGALSTASRKLQPPCKEIIATIPFQYGKEYLLTLQAAREHLDSRETSP